MKKINLILLFVLSTLLYTSCNDDDDTPTIPITSTDTTITYDLGSKDVAGIFGTAKFTKNTDESVTVLLELIGTPNDGLHPAHIHFNTAAEGGDIAVSLNPVVGSNGSSITVFNSLDDGTEITYDDMLDFDGYINVHLSSSELSTIVAQGDIGQNDLNGNTKAYDLGEKAVEGISGDIIFSERVNGEVLSTINISGTPDGGMHPAHIHENTAAEGGEILLSFTPVNGDTGISNTNLTSFNDGSVFTFSAIENLDAYVNVHLSADNLETLVAQGDIGQNDLNGNFKTYDLGEKDVEGISGDITFSERINGEVLAEIMLNGTPDDGMHPAHIHENTAVEGGDILLTFTPVNGTSGMSATNISTFNDGSSFSFGIVENIDAYVNVHLSADDLGTIVAQGDIGQNDLTGVTKTYDLGEKDVAGISGEVIFSERLNGEALAQLIIKGTPAGGMHPAHIHENTAAEGGAILFSFNPVNGDTGLSITNVSVFDDGSSFMYSDIENLDAYVNVHLNADNLETVVSQGDIGQNDLTGITKTYDLGEKDVTGISGDVVFSERINGETLAQIMLTGTLVGGMHPAHIHANTAAEGGGILFTFNPVNGDTGISATNISTFDDDSTFNYSELEDLDAYINVHLSASNLATIVAQGDIGRNDLTGESKVYDLGEKDVTGISGTATFFKRIDGSALAVLDIQNTPAGGMHPSHIHENDAASGGPIAFTFNSVNGDTGISMTQLEMLDDDTSFGYDDLLTFDGYINVHLSASQLSTIVAQGNIGSNE